MVKEIIFFLFLLVLFYGVGILPSLGLLKGKRFLGALAPVTGLAISGLLNLILWVNGTTIKFNYYVICILAIIGYSGLIWLFCKKKVQFEEIFPLKIILTYVLGAMVILSPLLINGPRFSFFQGNIWDTFGYWEASQIYAEEKFETIKNYTESDINDFPLRKGAKKDLYSRPGIHALYAMVSYFNRPWAWRLHPIFLAFLLSIYILVALFFLENFIESNSIIHRKVFYFFSLAFPLGFWGQYIFDLNTWGNLSTVALIVSICWAYFELLKRPNWEMVWFLIIICSAVIHLYPEILVFYAPGFFFLFLKSIKERKNVGIKLIQMNLILFLGVMIFAGFHFKGSVEFVLNQVKFGTGETQGMWTYFQKFYFGQGDLALNLKQKAEEVLLNVKAIDKTHAVGSVNWVEFLLNYISSEGGIRMALGIVNNLILGVWGLYFLTLPSGIDPLWEIVYFGISFLGIYLLGKSIIRSLIRSSHLRDLVLILIATTCLFILKKQFWSFGKAITFVMPIYFLNLKFSLLKQLEDRKVSIQNLTLVFFFLAQISWGIYRPLAVKENGVHFPYPPYPSLQKHVSHLKFLFNRQGFSSDLNHCSILDLSLVNPWASRIIEAYAISNKKIITGINSQKLIDKNYPSTLVVRKDETGTCHLMF